MPKQYNKSKIPKYHVPPEEMLEVAESCAAFAKVKNKGKQKFILCFIDNSNLGRDGLAHAMGMSVRTVFNYLEDPEVLKAIRAVSLNRCSMANAMAGSLKDIVVSRIADKLLGEEPLDVSELCQFEQKILLDAWENIMPTNSNIKLTKTETISGSTGNIQDLLSEHLGKEEDSSD